MASLPRLAPTCAVRFYVGAGVPGRRGRYRGQPVTIDRDALLAVLEREIGRDFPAATYFKARGVWQGAREPSIVIEVFQAPVAGSCDRLLARATRTAARLARRLGQDAVLVVATAADGTVRQGLARAAT